MSNDTINAADIIGIPEEDSWEQLEDDYHKALAMPYRPDASFSNPRAGTIIDEEKSVRWNRDEVQRRQEVYKEESRRLNRLRNAVIASIDNRAVALIAHQSGLSKEKAGILWRFVHEMHPAYGQMFEVIDQYIDLVIQLPE